MACLTPACCLHLQVDAALSAEQLCQSLQAAFQQKQWQWTYLLRMAMTFMPATLGRSDDLRKLPWSCLALRTQDNVGPVPSVAILFGSMQGKTVKPGQVDIPGVVRYRDHRICPQAALADLAVATFHRGIKLEDLAKFIVAAPSMQGNQPMSGETLNVHLRQAFELAGVPCGRLDGYSAKGEVSHKSKKHGVEAAKSVGINKAEIKMAARERNIREVFSMYEVTFAKLSERFFKGSTWPPVEMVADLVDKDHVFCLLYKEITFRHLYATQQPSLEQRRASWENYVALFKVILESKVNMQHLSLFLFQSFSQYRGKMAHKTAHEVELLRDCVGVWDVNTVLQILQSLIDKSQVAQKLGNEDAQRRFAETEGYEAQSSNVLRTLGYFSLIGLLRMHTLLGDYEAALKALSPIHPFRNAHSLTSSIAGCHITLYYYAGFSYLMVRRWLDAARAFNIVLSYIARVKQHLSHSQPCKFVTGCSILTSQVKQYHSRSSQYDQILKKNEQMHALTAITLAMCPAAEQLLEEGVSNLLKEKYGDKIQRMHRGEQGTFEELFTYSCPKFVTAAPHSLDAPAVNTNQEAYRQQLRIFLAFVDQTRHLPALKQFLKLYTSISLTKLAGLMDMDSDNLSGQLQVLKVDVEFKLTTDANGKDVISMLPVKAPRNRNTEFLIKHIAKFQKIVQDFSDMAPAGAAPPKVAAY
eukprot:jgi/Astpho2/8661/Aster-05134